MVQKSGVGRSDAAFAAAVFVVALVVTGVVIALLNRGSDASGVNPAAGHSEPLVATGSTRAAVVAAVERNFALSMNGGASTACAMESPAYLRFDDRHYPGGCVGATTAVKQQAQAKGISMRLDGVRIVSFGARKATVVTTVTIANRKGTEHGYLRYLQGQWWLTGGDDSHGDLGF